MEEETKKTPEQPEKESLKEKAKKLLDKADDFIDDTVEKVKKTKAFDDVTKAAKKAEDYVEDKIEDVKKSGIKEKLNKFADKAEEFGKKVAGKTAEKLDDIAENLRKKSKDETEKGTTEDNSGKA